MANLTPKQEKFAQEIASGKMQAEAYRLAYNASGMNPDSVYKRASELMAKGEISGRVDELRSLAADKIALNASYVLEGIMRITASAEFKEEHQAALKGLELLGRHLKLFTDKTELAGAGGGPITVAVSFVDPADEK